MAWYFRKECIVLKREAAVVVLFAVECTTAMLVWRTRVTARISLVGETSLINVELQAIKARKGNISIALLFALSSALGVVGGQSQAPAALCPGKTRYPLNRRLREPQHPSRRVRKISPPTGFDPRTVQPVASRYIDYAVTVHLGNRPIGRYFTTEPPDCDGHLLCSSTVLEFQGR
jgi:hypothetical protein